jgi:hypothetical protein
MSENYDLPSFVKDLDRYSDSDDSWTAFKLEFARRPAPARIVDLQTADSWLKEMDRPTREHASTMAAKRELVDLHFALSKVGR